MYLSCQVNPHLTERGEVYMLIFELWDKCQSSTAPNGSTVSEVQLFQVPPRYLFAFALCSKT